MGTTFRAVIYAADEGAASRAAKAAFERVEQLEDIFSDYRPESEAMRLCRDGCRRPLPVSADLFRLLQASLGFSSLTRGAFDVTIGPLTELWRQAQSDGRVPDDAGLARARARIGYRNIELDGRARTVRLRRCDMRLDFGGIAKGYAVGEALALIRERGFVVALVAGGGDISVGASPPGKAGWRISLGREDGSADASRVLLLHDCAISTSGDAYQYIDRAGSRRSHIIDPKRGDGTTAVATTTVIARDGMTADALATALSVMSVGDAMKIVDALDGVSAELVRRTADGRRRWTSSRFPKADRITG
jgi:FAD:protein FMN transferase